MLKLPVILFTLLAIAPLGADRKSCEVFKYTVILPSGKRRVSYGKFSGEDGFDFATFKSRFNGFFTKYIPLGDFESVGFIYEDSIPKNVKSCSPDESRRKFNELRLAWLRRILFNK